MSLSEKISRLQQRRRDLLSGKVKGRITELDEVRSALLVLYQEKFPTKKQLS